MCVRSVEITAIAQHIKLQWNSPRLTTPESCVNLTSTSTNTIILNPWGNLQLFPWNMFLVGKQCCLSNDLLSISSSKTCFRHIYFLFKRLGLLFSMNAICQVKTWKKWGQHMGPPPECVWERVSFSPSLYFGELERRLSASLFPTNQVLPTCQPRREAFHNTLLINKPPMHPFRFYSANTSAIETLEKKNYIIAWVDPFTLHTAWIDVCVVLSVWASIAKVRTKFFTQAPDLFFFLKVLALHWCAGLCRHWQGVLHLSGSWKAWIAFPPS